MAVITTADGPPSERATHVAPIAPATIWPSTPMFHSPAWNVTISPAAASTSGIHVINVSDSLASVPNEPSHSRRSASSGGASTSDEEQHGDAEGDGDADARADGRASRRRDVTDVRRLARAARR